MGQFLILLLIVLGYFVLLTFVLNRADNRQPVSTVAVLLLLVYGCVVGMLAAIRQYLGELGLLLYGFALVYSCIYWAWKLYTIARQGPRIQLGALLTFLAYLLAVLYITTFMREGGSNFQVQMEVFNWMRGAEGSVSFDHVLLNVAMFVPVGFLFPLITNTGENSFLSGVSFGMLFSVLIETGQLVFHYGACDIDDILANTLGAAVGTGITVIGLKMRRKSRNQG